MTLQKIRTKSTGHLTSLERDSFANLVDQSNSNFRVKAGSVVDVSLEALDPGAIVYNEADGKMYFCDDEWWNPAGVPIKLKVVYTDTQFAFKFQAPSGSTLQIYDGDGTLTAVAGNDAVDVTHTTSYAVPGSYYFYVEGDYLDLTKINIPSQSFVSGDISRWSELINLKYLGVALTSVSGDVSKFSILTSLVTLKVSSSLVTGNIESWAALLSVATLQAANTSVSGDISGLGVLTAPGLVRFDGADITFDKIETFNDISTAIWINDCGLSSAMVDNALQSFALLPITNCLINVDGTNAARTSASDAAKATLLTAGNTVTVNE